MNDSTIHSYKDLTVWQRAMELVVEVYKVTEQLPVDERFGLVSQMRRCAVSIPSNIAEGRRRGSRKDYHKFILIAYGSAAELETQLEIINRLPFGKTIDTAKAEKLLNETIKMLNKMASTLRQEEPKKPKS